MTAPKDGEWSGLRELAEAATPGPWSYDQPCKWKISGGEPLDEWGNYWSVENEDCKVAATVELASERDAAYIAAANPATILELLTRLERYEKALKRIKDGGVPNGVRANVEERMLAMCDIATEALASGAQTGGGDAG